MHESLRIEISRPRPGEWRVVERSHHAAESVFQIPFDADELAELLIEINACLLDANANPEPQMARLRRLGGRLAEMTLPQMLREKLSTHAGLAEFFLDDASIILPVELYPHSDAVLGEAMPVSRHWFCEGSRAAPRPGQVESNKDVQVLIVADPAENLPAAQQEGKALLRKLRSQKGWKCRYSGRAMTVAGLSRELPDTDVFHLAAHYSAGEKQNAPGIMMADGRWLPADVFPTPEVVFVNCCHAGMPVGDDGNLSLAGYFLKHGSRHVIAPFLPVSDQAAAQFAKAFYEAFLLSNDVGRAVWSAKRAVGPASWMYWHFGPASKYQSRETPQATHKKRRYFPTIILALAAIFVAALPWMVPVGRSPAPNPEAIATVENTAPIPFQLEEQSTTESAKPPPTEAIESDRIDSTSSLPESGTGSGQENSPDESVAPESAAALGGEPGIAAAAVVPEAVDVSIPKTPASIATSPKDDDLSERESNAPLEIESVVVPPSPETENNITPSPKPPIAPAFTSADGSSISEPEPNLSHAFGNAPEASSPIGQPPITSEKPGLFKEALAKIERQQSLEDAVIQVLDGYPERYMHAAVKGEPDYDVASGKATLTVEVSISQDNYLTMAEKLSEVLHRFGYTGERVAATMKRPYDEYLEVHFRFSERRRFRDMLLLCTRANDALTDSAWELVTLPRSTIDVVMSSISVPILTVSLVNSSGIPVITKSQDIPRPFVATEARALMIMPIFEDGSADMTVTSLIPGRNRIALQVEFTLSAEELKKVADIVPAIEIGNKLPQEFQYQFLR